MNIKERYESAEEVYVGIGVDVEEAVKKLEQIPIFMHCWQGDDVMGFEGVESLLGGIQATGSYPERAKTPQELMDGIGKALSLIPGTRRLNLHVGYAIFEEGQQVDRDALKPEHFVKWVEFAKARGLGLDFNPTMFSHPKAENATLSSEDEEVRKSWIEHCKAYVRISGYFVTELGKPVSMNIWTPDGFKDAPTDRTSPKAKLKDSLDQVLAMDYNRSKIPIAVELKVFGIGMESCTVDPREFYMNYAVMRGIMCLLDGRHFHPTEMISGKISSILLFSDKVALHVSRPVRQDSNHVVLFDDETREIAKEIVRGGVERVLLALDFFNVNISRIATWVTGMRNMERALLCALLMPNEKLAKLQEEWRSTELMTEQEELKTYPFGDVWDYYCESYGVPVKEQWFAEVEKYEKEVLAGRQNDRERGLHKIKEFIEEREKYHMNVLETRFAQGFTCVCDDGSRQNWHERNGGSLSYRLKKEEMEAVKDALSYEGDWQLIGTGVPKLDGEYFMVSDSRKFMRNMILDPEANCFLCISPSPRDIS